MSKEEAQSISPYESPKEYREEISASLGDWATRYTEEARPFPRRENYEERLGYRTEFQRDRDDILYSPSFRRLAYKRQMFSGSNEVQFYTRLTHTLIVSQLARSIARGLRLDEHLTEAIALGHDLGHAPYGHSGEDGINEWINSLFFPKLNEDIGVKAIAQLTIRQRIVRERELRASSVPQSSGQMQLFEMPLDTLLDRLEQYFYCKPDHQKIFTHNGQSYRIVRFLEKDGSGLELSLYAYYGIFRASGKSRDDDDFELLGERLSPKFASFEGQVVRLADDIAWANHDLTEDSRRNEISPIELLRQYIDEETKAGLENHREDIYNFLNLNPGERYGQFVTDAIEQNKDNLTKQGFIGLEAQSGYHIELSPKMQKYLNDMKKIVSATMHESLNMKKVARDSQNEVVSICQRLYSDSTFIEHISERAFRHKDPTKFDDLEIARVIADQVAILSDHQAHDYFDRNQSAMRELRKLRSEEQTQKLIWDF